MRVRHLAALGWLLSACGAPESARAVDAEALRACHLVEGSAVEPAFAKCLVDRYGRSIEEAAHLAGIAAAQERAFVDSVQREIGRQVDSIRTADSAFRAAGRAADLAVAKAAAAQARRRCNDAMNTGSATAYIGSTVDNVAYRNSAKCIRATQIPNGLKRFFHSAEDAVCEGFVVPTGSPECS